MIQEHLQERVEALFIGKRNIQQIVRVFTEYELSP